MFDLVASLLYFSEAALMAAILVFARVSAIVGLMPGAPRRTLYGVNFGFLSQADFGANPRPALVAVDTGVPGQPIP